MICLISLVVFGLLGIFSISFRGLAKEAFDCVFRKITLRPCKSNLDERMKSKIVAKVFNASPPFSRFVNKYFAVLSWIFVILVIVSLALVIRSGYLLAVHGTCDPENPESCIFTPEDFEVPGNCTCEEESSCASLEKACEECSCSEELCEGTV